MTRITTATAALLATTTLAQAGGIDRNYFSIAPLFEEGNYVELSYSNVSPDVSGTGAGGIGTSGDMAVDYSTVGFAFRTDLSDRLSVAFTYEDVWGADISYQGSSLGTYPFHGFNATLSGTSSTLYLGYQATDRITVYGGVRYVVMNAEINYIPPGNVGPFPITGAQTLTYADDGDFGWAIGAAYEIPEIALRVSLTYNSATDHENTITSSGAVNLTGVAVPPTLGPFAATSEYSLPQSVILEAQSGVAEGTLVLGSIRWTDWSEADIPTNSALGVIENDDVWTFTLGAARRLTDDFAILANVLYETSTDDPASNLAPTDGRLGLSLAGIYDITDQLTLTGGINYTMLGDATTETVFADFADNDSLGFGLRLGFNF